MAIASQRLNAMPHSTQSPSPITVAKWANTVPEGFTFCPKFPQTITHQGPLKPHLQDALNFIDLMQGLGKHLGPIFVQLPPSYAPNQLNDLSQFLRALPTQSVKIAVEVRHTDWFKPAQHQNLTQLLTALQVGQVLLDSRPMYEVEGDPQLHSQRRKPQVPLMPQLTAPFTLIRFISHPVLVENERFMDTWIAPLRQWTQEKREIYFFMHCPIEEQSPAHAKYFHGKLGQSQIERPPLPWDSLEKPPAQLNLFA